MSELKVWRVFNGYGANDDYYVEFIAPDEATARTLASDAFYAETDGTNSKDFFAPNGLTVRLLCSDVTRSWASKVFDGSGFYE